MSIDIKKTVFRFALTTMIIAFLPLCIFSASAITSAKELGVTGLVSLGSTRKQVLTAMGNPNSPLASDYSYRKGDSEILIVFDDNTDLVASVIVIGKNPKYSVRGITGGNTKAEVKKVFGNPERVVDYRKSRVECWYYPSKNVNFAISGDKVSSFGVSNVTFVKR